MLKSTFNLQSWLRIDPLSLILSVKLPISRVLVNFSEWTLKRACKLLGVLHVVHVSTALTYHFNAIPIPLKGNKAFTIQIKHHLFGTNTCECKLIIQKGEVHVSLFREISYKTHRNSVICYSRMLWSPKPSKIQMMHLP